MIFAGLCIAITVQGAAAKNDPWAAKDWETLRAQLIAHADETGNPVSALLLNPSNFDTDISVGSAIYLDRSTRRVDSVYDSSAFRSINVVIAAMNRIYFRDQVQADGTRSLRDQRSTSPCNHFVTDARSMTPQAEDYQSSL